MSAGLARLAALSPQARATLMQRLRAARRPPPGEPGCAAASPEQVRLWLLQRLQPDNPAYNLAGAFRIRGPLDTAAVTAALQEITRRHEPLRTAFVAVDGLPTQRISAALPVTVRQVDLRDLPPAERDSRAIEVVTNTGREPFDLQRAPLARYLLVRTSEEGYLLGLVVHHLIADGWSFVVFATEFVQLYQAFAAGARSPLAEITVPYRHLAREHADRRAAEDFWRHMLRGDLPVLELPTDRPRPATQTFNGRQLGFELPTDLTAELDRQCAREGRTVFSSLLASFAVLLHRATGQEDLVIGVPVARRGEVGAESLIGFFVNTLPIRLDLLPLRSHADASRQTHEVMRRALAHQDIPFDRIVQLVRPRRDPSRPVLRQVAFAVQELPAEHTRLGGLTVETVRPAELDLGVARLDLSVHMWRNGDRLEGLFEYNTDLFDHARVAHWAEQYADILRESVHAPDSPLRAGGAVEQSNLTESQLLFYFGRQYQAGVRLYYEHITSVFTLQTDVDGEHLRRAFQALVDRSDALRSVFHEVEGIPRRRVLDAVAVELDVVDLSGAPSPDVALRDWVNIRNGKDFDLGERLFDTALVRLGPDRFAWYLSVHHLVSDAWSTALILRRVSDYYELSREGRLAEAGPLPAYQDYVRWERELRESPRYRRSADYWRSILADPVSRLAFYGSEGSPPGTRIARRSVDLGPERTRRIQELAMAEGLTSAAIVFSTVLFAYLHRVSGSTLLRIGTPFANRASQFRETIGLFMNACPVQVKLAGDEDFRSLARHVQLALLQAAHHQEYPVRNPADDPTYDVYFNFQSARFHGFGHPVEVDIVGTGHSNDRLALQVRDFASAGTFQLDFDFNADCFGGADRDRTVKHYLGLLDTMLDDPSGKIDSVGMLTEAETHQVLVEWNRTDRRYDLATPLHRHVERQVLRTPGALAVVSARQRLTYGETNAAANRLAWRLRGHGVSRGSIVGVCMERSAELVVALLGVLKAGAAYLPLDPDYPADRLAHMMTDSAIPVVVTQQRLAGRLPASKAHVVTVDAADVSGAAIIPNPDAGVAGEDVAYVMYTSGSTGRPKGVLVPHRGIGNRLLWMQEEYRLSSEDRVLQKTPFGFDVSVWEFFWPLMTGAAIVVAEPGGHKDPAYLVDVIVEHGVTTLHFVPSMLRVFLDTPTVGRCVSLRQVFSSGEALPADLPPRLFALLPAQLHNLYGPTEASVDVSYWSCRPDWTAPTVPIGRPVANTQIYLADQHGNLVPPGIAGELYIGGVQVADGYLNQPGLTAGRFVSDPFRPGRKLYRTGDLARHRQDGTIEFLGRTDNQIKLHGLRVEPGEIEAEIQRSPRVRAAVVSLWNDQLVAHVMPSDDALSTEELRTSLGKCLPDHMIPSAFVVVPAMPVTANGKLDRRALPPPDLSSPTGYVAPRTPLEESIARLWAQELGRDRIGVFDNFFDIGGHSLLAARLMTRVSGLLGVDLPLGALFRAPTVAALAVLVNGAAGHGGTLVPIRATGSRPPLFVFHPAGGDLLAYQGLATALDQDLPVIGVQSRAAGGHREHESLAEMAAEYAAAILAEQRTGPYFLAGWSMGGVVAVSVADLLERDGREVAFVGLIDSYVPEGGTPDPLLAPAAVLAGVVGDVAVEPQRLDALRRELHGLPLGERLERVTAWAREQGRAVPAAAHASLRRQAELVALHEGLLLRHRPPVARAELTVFSARDKLHSRDTDWARYTSGPVHRRTVPGNHFTLLRPPNVEELAASLDAALRSASGGAVATEGGT
jgi:amino acid adenylation domain-containing protein